MGEQNRPDEKDRKTVGQEEMLTSRELNFVADQGTERQMEMMLYPPRYHGDDSICRW